MVTGMHKLHNYVQNECMHGWDLIFQQWIQRVGFQVVICQIYPLICTKLTKIFQQKLGRGQPLETTPWIYYSISLQAEGRFSLYIASIACTISILYVKELFLLDTNFCEFCCFARNLVIKNYFIYMM